VSDADEEIEFGSEPLRNGRSRASSMYFWRGRWLPQEIRICASETGGDEMDQWAAGHVGFRGSLQLGN
jgi:hypothetical protein